MCIRVSHKANITLYISLHKYIDDLLRLDAYKKTLKRYTHYTFTNRKNKYYFSKI